MKTDEKDFIASIYYFHLQYLLYDDRKQLFEKLNDKNCPVTKLKATLKYI